MFVKDGPGDGPRGVGPEGFLGHGKVMPAGCQYQGQLANGEKLLGIWGPAREDANKV